MFSASTTTACGVGGGSVEEAMQVEHNVAPECTIASRQNSGDPDLKKCVVYAKTDEQRYWLRSHMTQLSFLLGLDEMSNQEVVDAFEFSTLTKAYILNPDGNDFVYIVEFGTFEEYANTGPWTLEPVKAYKADDFYIELAHQDYTKRAATLITKTDCSIAALVSCSYS